MWAKLNMGDKKKEEVWRGRKWEEGNKLLQEEEMEKKEAKKEGG